MNSAEQKPPPVPPGRPSEIEEWTNLVLIHPLSRKLVDRLIPTGISPNAVSVAGVFVAAAGASAYAFLVWPASAFAGLALYVIWHVVDGADGDLARRTGRASLRGEIVDGICDHLSQVILYGALGWMAFVASGWVALPLAAFAGLSHFLQANSYETARRKYRRWVYGATSLREELKPAKDSGVVARALGLFYLSASKTVAVDDSDLEGLMARLVVSPVTAETARRLYREYHQPIVKRRAVLSSNHRTIMAFLSVFAGLPIAFFIYEVTILNAAMAWLNHRQRMRNALLLSQLERI
jgi:phosphatidylglycerophosphate synthase